MALDCVVKKGEEIASTSSKQGTTENQEMCLMEIESGTTHLVGEEQSIVRPPLFVGDNYTYWKIRMRLFI